MFSSKIIKARTGSEYRCFDFLDINSCRTPLRDGRGKDSNGAAKGAAGSAGAEQVVEQLQQELQERILEMDERAREIEQEAYAKGFDKGREEGARQAMEEVRRIEELLEELSGLRACILEDYRDWLISSSLEIAKHVIQREVRIQPELLLQAMESALNLAGGEPPLVFHLHPDDLQLLQEKVDLGRLKGSGKSFELREDGNLTRGGCRLESNVQLIDCSLEARLKLVEEEIRTEPENSEDGSTDTGG